MNHRDVLKAQRPTNAQVQDQRRRANQQPSIHAARVQADLARNLPIIGSSMRWWGLSDPGGEAGGMFMIEDGRLLNVIDYPELYEILGTRFNTGAETAGQFRLPDSRGRTGVGAGATPDVALTDRSVGDKFGVEEVTLSTLQMPSHKHVVSIDDNTHNHAADPVAAPGKTGEAGGHNHGGTDSGGAHDHGGLVGSSGAHNHGGSTGAGGSHSHTVSSGKNSNTATGGTSDRLTGFDVFGDAVQTVSAPDHSHGISNHDGHQHSIPNHPGHFHGIPPVDPHRHELAPNTHKHTNSMTETGGGSSHQNVQPSIAVNYIIRVLP